MADLTPIDEFTEVYQLETTDQVVGGPGGKSNRQAQQLANRTLWLKNRYETLRTRKIDQEFNLAGVCDVDDFAANKTILVAGDGGGLLTLTLAEIADFDDATEGLSIRFKNGGQFDGGADQQGNSTVLRIKCNASEAFIVSEGNMPGDAPMTHIDLNIGDMLELTVVKDGIGGYWFFVSEHVQKRQTNNIEGVFEMNDDSGENPLTAADLRKLLRFGVGGVDVTYVLPPVATVPDNHIFRVICSGSMIGTGRLKKNAGDANNIFVGGVNVASLNFNDVNSTVQVLKYGSTWYVIDNSL